MKGLVDPVIQAIKVVGKICGASLTLAGVAGVAVTAIYLFDLDDKAVGFMVDSIHKAGKLMKLRAAASEG